ncbi:MAG TPA: M48 family peptidase [Candidatus Tenderia electrophaga]|uniref:M48 family peptidase n=1 Tax=Candidatus Tenderia electrophaga TaxID=1748243 RepID=A0A832J2T6_9GAMM|nr:M48 family peptidase [Candidatus Tenderia electrophaga]
MSALPPYSVRVSLRAKRLQMKVLPPGKVEVVVPRRCHLKHVPAFVAEHRQWLQFQLDKMATTYAEQPLLPTSIYFPAIDETWQVAYVDQPRGRLIELATGQLQLCGLNESLACQSLQRWLQQRARQVLPDWLAQVAVELGLGFNRVAVRGQKTRWGSCSAQQNINLNRALLFVSPGAVRYLMVHELCHTLHLNHSPSYWALVANKMPEYEKYETELRQALSIIPAWAQPGVGG